MKINIIDENDRQQTLKFVKGFQTGKANTIANIIHAHESGQSLKSIYKYLKKEYNENNNQ